METASVFLLKICLKNSIFIQTVSYNELVVIKNLRVSVWALSPDALGLSYVLVETGEISSVRMVINALTSPKSRNKMH